MSNRRGNSAQVRPNALSVSPRTTTRSVSTEQSSRGEECQTSTRDQGEPAGRSSSSTDSMSEASACCRRAALQWICVAGVRRALKVRLPS